MAYNPIQFQRGMSLPEFLQCFGTEAACGEAVRRARWPDGFVCPRCGGSNHCIIVGAGRSLFQCHACHRQTSLTAGTLFDSTKLPLTRWFLAIYLISQAKTGLSALELKRDIGVSYPTAWLMHHKIMSAMAAREAQHRLSGDVQVDDAYLGGERAGGKPGRGSENKVPIVAAVSLTEDGHPRFAKITPVPPSSTPNARFALHFGFELNGINDLAEFGKTCVVARHGAVRDGKMLNSRYTCFHVPEAHPVWRPHLPAIGRVLPQ